MLSLEELRKLDLKELEKSLEKARFDLYKIKLVVIDGTEKQNHKIAELKRYIAHIRTTMSEKRNEVQAVTSN